MGWRYKGGAFAPSYRYLLGMGLNTLFYFVSYQGLVEAAASPAMSSASMYIDLLGLTVLVQFVSLYSHYVWYLHLIVSKLWMHEALDAQLLSEQAMWWGVQKSRKAAGLPIN